MAGKSKNTDSEYRVYPHKANGYLYAATCETIYKDGKRIRKYTHWGSLSLDNKFSPNLKYKTTPVEEREKLIFPDHWDISEAEKLNKAKHDGDNRRKERTEQAQIESEEAQNEVGNSDGPVIVSVPEDNIVRIPASTQFEDRLYGAVWFLLQIAQQKHIVEDLKIVFEYNDDVVNDILTLAIYPYLTNASCYDRLQNYQRIYKFPTTTELTSSYITRLSQAITEHQKMELCKLRIARQPKGAYFACDSTTRTAWGRCLAMIGYGRNKDNKELNCTLEVVLYSLTTHEPVYYRSFPGNAPDARTVMSIAADMAALGVNDYTTVYDRGYSSEENSDEFFRRNLPFVSCSKVAVEPVVSCLELITYDAEGLPTNMKRDRETGLHYAQFQLTGKHFVDAKGEEQEVSGSDFKCNVYLDSVKRTADLLEINTEKCDEYEVLRGKTNDELLAEKAVINKKLHYHTVNFDKKTDSTGKESWDVSISENPSKIQKAKATCGYFSSITYKTEGNALEILQLYKTRDEQEKYFEQMKDLLGCDTQNTSTELTKNGRELILFTSLILTSTVRNTWKTDLELKSKYNSSKKIIDEMRSIKLREFPDGTSQMTAFIGEQVSICKAFGLEVPIECLPAEEKKAIIRKNNPQKPGRKPKGTPAPHKIIPVLIGV